MSFLLQMTFLHSCKGSFNNYVDKMRGQKMSVFVLAQGIKTVHAGGGSKKQHVVVEWPLMQIPKWGFLFV